MKRWTITLLVDVVVLMAFAALLLSTAHPTIAIR